MCVIRTFVIEAWEEKETHMASLKYQVPRRRSVYS